MFVSGFFVPFFVTALVAFWLSPVKWRPFILLMESYLFLMKADVRSAGILFFWTICLYSAGRILELHKNRILFSVFISISCAILFVYKYSSYLLDLFGLGPKVPAIAAQALVIPVGISFYMFQSMGYLIDIYKGDCKAEKSFLSAALFLSFFPKIVSGPIVRNRDFLPQIRRFSQEHFWNTGRFSKAAAYILWGLFFKLIIADRLAGPVSSIFTDPGEYDSIWLLAGAVLYSIQLYCDFAGYSYIAVGCALLFGISLQMNFCSPYAAKDITDFWKRWHISLSSWLRDYVYIPLGGNRKGKKRAYLNTLLIFLLCGMWHGAGLHYVVWGLLHGVYVIADRIIKQHNCRIPFLPVITFFEVVFAWIFFKAKSLEAAIDYICRIFQNGSSVDSFLSGYMQFGLGKMEWIVVLAGIGLIFWTERTFRPEGVDFPAWLQSRHRGVRYLVFYLMFILILVFGNYGPGNQHGQFIYMQF